MYGNIKEELQKELDAIVAAGLYKKERIITTPQAAKIATDNGVEVLNFCANNYLGLSSHPEVVKAGIEAIETHGFGMSSVRFICGTQDIHKELERKRRRFWGRKTAYCMQLRLTQTVAFLNRYWVIWMQLFQTS